MYKYIKLILRYFWIILFLPAVTGGAQFALDTLYLEKVYEAKTTMLVLHKPDPETTGRSFEDNAYQSLLASEMLVKDYKEIIKTGIVIEKMREELKDRLPWLNTISDNKLYRNIAVSVKTETRIITVAVKDNDAEAAALIANKIAEIFENQSMELIGSDYITILDIARAPEAPISPKPLRDTAMAVAGGLLAGIAVILFIDYMKTQKLLQEPGDDAAGRENSRKRKEENTGESLDELLSKINSDRNSNSRKQAGMSIPIGDAFPVDS